MFETVRNRDTRTGAILEQMVLPALASAGYACHTQVGVGARPGGGRHVVDVVAAKDGRRFLVSLKWQQVAGTAEQKVPYEVICLSEAILAHDYDAAYLVLGGPGWKLREWFVGGGLRRHLVHADRVHIETLESFIALANRGGL